MSGNLTGLCLCITEMYQILVKKRLIYDMLMVPCQNVETLEILNIYQSHVKNEILAFYIYPVYIIFDFLLLETF